jgi:hypothetical protein
VGSIEGGKDSGLTGDVGLLDAVLGRPLGEDVGHGLRREGDLEGKLCLVSRHGSDVLWPKVRD